MKLKSLMLPMAAMIALAISSPATTLTPGDILISNHFGNNVQLEHGGVISTLVSVSSTPIGLAFDGSGLLYINSDNGIQRYDPNTNTLNASFFTGVGQREGLTFDPVSGHLFSVSFGNNAIEEVDLAGNLVRTIHIPGTTQILGITARNGNLIVTDYGAGKVYIGSTTGSSFTQVGPVIAPSNIYAADIDAAGNVYVNNFANGTVVKLDASASYTASNFISGLAAPANGLSIGDDGSFTISEFGANRVSVWNANGTFRTVFNGISNPDELVVFAPIRSSGGGGGTVPEPGSMVLLASGLASVAGVVRRKLRK
jgi:sugar lactone lactonase YvrE